MKEPATADIDTTQDPVRTVPGESSMHLVLIDGSGFIFRAFHALPPMTRPDGTPVNAVYGFASMLLKLLDDLRDHATEELIAVVYDTKRTTFRNEIYADYKA